MKTWTTIIRICLLLVIVTHTVTGLLLFVNRSSSSVMFDEAWHMLYYTQFSRGEHRYYPAEDLTRTYDGYTPFASQVFGWAIRFIGNDIRVVRFVAGMFGMGAIILIGLMVRKLTGSGAAAWIAAGLSWSVEPAWFMETGPNAMHVFFSLLGVWLLMRDPTLSWKTCLLATGSFFLSYWTKQTGLAYLATACIYFFFKDLKKATAASAISILLVFVTAWIFENKPDSRFIYLVFQWNQNQPIIWNRLWMQLLPLYTERWGIVLAFTALGIISYKSWLELFRSPAYVFMGASFVIGSYTACKYGSGLNQAWFFFCMLLVCGTTTASQLLRKGMVPEQVLLMLFIIQGIALYQDPRPSLIAAEDEQRFGQIMDILRTPGKKTYYINSGYLNLILGQEYYANVGHDVWQNGEFRPETYPQTWRDFLATNPWDIVIIDIPAEDGSFPLYEMLNRAYQPITEIPADSRYPQHGRLRFRKVVFERKP